MTKSPRPHSYSTIHTALVQANDLLGVRSNAADSPKSPASLAAGHVSASDADDEQADTYPTAILDSGNTVNVTHPTVEIWPPEAAKRRTVSGRGVTVEDVQSTGRGKIQYRFRAPIHLLVMYERGERRSGDSFVEGLPRSALRNLARKLTFVPAGYQYNEWYEPSSDTRRLHFYFDPAEFRIQSSLPSQPFAPHLFFDDATLWQTALKLRGLVDSSASGDPHYLDTLSRLLVHELVRFNLGLGGFRPTIRGGLAPWQQRLVSKYIKEHFSERIPIAVIARTRRTKSLSFLPNVQTIFRDYTAPVPDELSDRTGQGPPRRVCKISDGHWPHGRVQHVDLIRGGVPKSYRIFALRVP